MRKNLLLLLFIIAPANLVLGQDFNITEKIFLEAFDTIDGTFVLYNLEENSYYYYHEKRAGLRFPPMSTYKIPNSLIALETGVLENANSIIRWDSTQVPCSADWNYYPTTEWCRDQTLGNAFKYSVVWFYQEVARQIGHEKMKFYLDKLNYGNKDIDAGIDNFWFWKLKISAKEQVEFLKEFYLEEIDFDPEHIGTVKDIMMLEETDNYILYGKTGGGEIGDNLVIGWFVGFVEIDNNVFIFALNIDGKDFITVRDIREKIARNILEDLNILH